ncbi:alpha/beta-Hydrolases superfamily protein [Euphorbia peplus]|nr:alpha/beta-Hydrolases superfamily protein [Euphorbia peplus]
MEHNDQQWPPNIPWYLYPILKSVTFIMDMCRRTNGSVNRRLFNFIDRKTPPSEKPINGVKSTDITVDKSRDLWFRLYTPSVDSPTAPNAVNLPVVFFFHGGGFIFMAANSFGFDDLCRRLSRELSAFVISVNYRLAPEHRYPAQIEDCFDTLKFIDTTDIEGFPKNADLKRCFMAGDSAGGNLIHHVTVKLSETEISRVKVIGNVMIQPFFGGEERTASELRFTKAPLLHTESTDWMWKAMLPVGSDRDHAVVNVFGPNAVDIAGIRFPATIVFVGGYDLLKDWQLRYCDGMKKNGKEVILVEYENAFHSFYCMPDLVEFGLMMKEVRNFIQKQSKAHM